MSVAKLLFLHVIILALPEDSNLVPKKCEERIPRIILDSEGNQIKHGYEWSCYKGTEQWKVFKAWENGKPSGRMITWYENGYKAEQLHYVEGKEEGKATKWYPSGRVHLEASYSKGKRNGKWLSWNPRGEKLVEGIFENGTLKGDWLYWRDELEGGSPEAKKNNMQSGETVNLTQHAFGREVSPEHGSVKDRLFEPGKTFSYRKDKWQAIYYLGGRLWDRGNMMWSPFFDDANNCIKWVYSIAKKRNNYSDKAECAYDCTKRLRGSKVLICTETMSVLGDPG